MTDARTVLAELDSKLTKSAASLDVYARAETRAYERPRLLGKAEGLRLARSYIQDWIHTLPDDTITTAEQLDALPDLTIIGLSNGPAPAREVVAVQKDRGDWLPVGMVEPLDPDGLVAGFAAGGTANVLWRPEAVPGE